MEMTELGLSQPLLKAISEMGFLQPTPIQEEAIPFLLENQGDLIALAATGTGKTAAFGLPLLQKLDTSVDSVQALVLCPTRELCRQITTELENFSRFLPAISVVAVYGGASIGKQIQQLRHKVEVVIATPGRIKDLQERKAVDLSSIKMLVLDEADEMLNMGFEEDLTAILSQTPVEKQTALFSATLSPRIAKIANHYLRSPKEISVGVKNQARSSVEHYHYLVYHTQRYQALRRILDFNFDFYGIVFCKTRQTTADVAAWLVRDGYKAEALHGEVAQIQRDTVMRRFRSGEIKILIATDVAARGIDVGNLTHVVHYELPEDSEAYIHRSGRTGRVDKTGISLAIVSPSERRKLSFLERLVKRKIELKELPSVTEIIERRLALLREELLAFLQVGSEEKECSEVEPLEEGDSSKTKQGKERLKKAMRLETLIPLYRGIFTDFSKEQLIDFLLNAKLDHFLRYYESCDPIKQVASIAAGRSTDRERKYAEPKEKKAGGEFFKERRGAASSRRISAKRTDGGGKYQRFFISLGKKDEIQPKDLIGFINQSTGDRTIPIGQIEMKSSFSFVEIESSYCDLVLKKSNGYLFKKRVVAVEKAEKREPSYSKEEKKGFKKGKKGSNGSKKKQSF